MRLREYFDLTVCRTDIEQEVNGLYTFDRKEKLDSSKVKELVEEALRAFYDRVGNAS